MTRDKRPGGRQVLALAAAAAFMVAAACGDDGESEGDSALSPFCQGFRDVEDKWGSLGQTDLGDETKAQGLISDLKSLDPPDEIADEWPVFVGTIETVADNPDITNDPEAASGLMENQEAIQTVQAHINEQCTQTE